jgi:peptide/nickel transport system permease protein
MRASSRFLSRWQILLGLTLVLWCVFIALAAPHLSPPDDADNPAPFKVVGRSTDRNPHPPSELALLGTLPGQLDVYHTLVWGTRSALRFGLVTALSAAVVGVLVGAISGYVGGVLNGFLMRVADAFLTFPTIAGVWLFQQTLIPPQYGVEMPSTWLQRTMVSFKLDPVMLTLILFSWMSYARIVNINVVQLRRIEYVEAARSVGVGNARIILRHILPNAIAPAIVLAARDVGAMVIVESAFAFIGMGGAVEWGVLLVTGRSYVIGIGGNPLAYWWTFLPASLALALFGVAWNLVGDGLNAALNPRAARWGG